MFGKAGEINVNNSKNDDYYYFRSWFTEFS